MANNKIKFLTIRAKNFRSIGNMWMELDYTLAKSTLIVSEDNGAGKSTLSIWALYYALFGKAYAKGVKIASLTNSKSNKECLVEVNFEARGSHWMVRRGIKPNIFEIHQDGKLITNEASLKDPQDYLQKVLGFDSKAFCTMVALGVDLFVPFVQMTTADRRAFVEQMLDLAVISDMNNKVKDRVKSIKKEDDQVMYDINVLDSRQAGHLRTLTILEGKKRQRLNETGDELGALEAEETKLLKMLGLTEAKLAELKGKIVPDANQKLSNFDSMLRRFLNKQKDIESAAEKITHLTSCPTCKQDVTEDHKHLITDESKRESAALSEPMAKLEIELAKAKEIVDENKRIQDLMTAVNAKKIQLDAEINNARNNIKSIKAKMVDSGEDDLIEKEKIASAEIESQMTLKTEALNAIRKRSETHAQLLDILKDSGIKANIVQQYLPFLNQSINATLDKLNLYVQINIDPEFNVTLFAPDRKGQTIENLSTGQLRRVDLAILLAWREIAKNKASVDCNILILDEILENLSGAGVEDFMEMWETAGEDIQLFVISQRNSEFDQYFQRTLKYKLANDVTTEVGV